MDAHFTTFLGVSVLVIIVPGPDMALVMRNALFGGRQSGICTGLGSATGLLVWTLATSAGLAALLIASQPLFVALKLAGAAYLVYLGVQALWGALRPAGHERVSAGLPGGGRRLAPLVAYRQGVVSNLGNPKIAVFFTSLLPQFLPAGDAAFGGLLLLGLIFCSLTLLWLTVYAAAVAKAGDVLRRPSIRRAIEGLTGAVLIGLGLRLAAERR
jgi:threonine/homoserine/homoserine lactone efflux protein